MVSSHIVLVLQSVLLQAFADKVYCGNAIHVSNARISAKELWYNAWFLPEIDLTKADAQEMKDDSLLTDFTDNQPHHDYVDNLVLKFDEHCQKDIDTMDTTCAGLLEKLKRHVKTELELPDLTRRRMTARVLCVTPNPIKFVWYNPTNTLCCEGLHDKVTGHEMCCGPDTLKGRGRRLVYDKTIQLCCGGALFNMTELSQECCGGYVYDTRKSIGCCNGQIYDMRHRFCCGKKTLHHNIGRRNSNGGCCGTEKFDDRCYGCNRSSPIPYIYSLFDPNTQRCCHGRIKTIQENKNVCCGKQLIDTLQFDCINNVIVVKTRLIEQNDSTSVDTTLKLHTEHFDEVSGVSEVNFEEQNDVETRDGKTNHWIALIIVLSAVSGCGFILIVVHHAKKHYCKKKAPVGGQYMTNDAKENTANDWTHVQEIRNLNMDASESNCESGYQSLQQTPGLYRELSVDTLGLYRELSIDQEENEAEISTNTESSKAGENDSKLPVIPYKNEFFESDWPKFSICFEKSFKNQSDENNFTSELFANAETQTFNSKEMNQRTIFGRSYQYSQYLTKFNKTIQYDNSDSKMTLPLSAVSQHPVLVQMSSFDDIPGIYEKFELPDQSRLASPVVEYCLTGCPELEEHAVLELPIIHSQVKVKKFASDGGIHQTSILEEVPVLEEEDFALDIFCIIRKVRAFIYTKAFSGFLCLLHGDRENFSLHAFLFASNKVVHHNQEVRLTLYIADELHVFTDFNQRMFSNEKEEGREKKAERPIELPECTLKGEDYLNITAFVSGDGTDKWEPKHHPKFNKPVEPIKKIKKIKDLARCCRSESSLPPQVSWSFINRCNSMPTNVVQCLVDIDCLLSDDRADKTYTPLIIDELPIRASDRWEILSDIQKVSHLKKYLIQHLQTSMKESFTCCLKKILIRFERDSTVFNSLQFDSILIYMEGKLNPTDFIESVAEALHQNKQYETLDSLVRLKYIPEHLLQKSDQPCLPFSDSMSEILTDASSIDSHSNGCGSSDSISQGECRAEIENRNICSFDNNNEDTMSNQQVAVARPRPELQNAADELDTDV